MFDLCKDHPQGRNLGPKRQNYPCLQHALHSPWEALPPSDPCLGNVGKIGRLERVNGWIWHTLVQWLSAFKTRLLLIAKSVAIVIHKYIYIYSYRNNDEYIVIHIHIVIYTVA